MKFRRPKLKCPCRPPKISNEVKEIRQKAVESKEIAEEQKRISHRLWDELLEIRQRNNIAAAISARWER